MLGFRRVALFLAGVAAACGSADDDLPLERVRSGEAEVTGRGVLVIVVDGLRWDHTSLAGYDRDTTPFLAEFARDAMVFTNAWSVSSSLVGSHVSILAGCDPSLAQPPDVRMAAAADEERPATESPPWFVPDDLWLLGRPFLGNGFATAAFVDHPLIAELRGFDRGFRTFVEYGGEPKEDERAIGAFGVGRRFVEWLNALPLDQDWFAYVHMNDLERAWFHGRRRPRPSVRGSDEGIDVWRARKEYSYVPPVGLTEPLFHALPPSRANRFKPVTLAEYELRYDVGIKGLDASLARLISTAEDYGRADEISIVVVGSFGTGLGEHGLYLQAGLAEDVDLHVPLLVRPSRALREELGWSGSQERRSDALVSLVDVAPTVVDLAAIPSRRAGHGVSLRPLLAGGDREVRRRVFSRSAVLPGFAVIDADGVRAAYDPSRAAASVARSWSRGRADDSGVEGDPDVAALWRRWDELMERERRALHFGLGSSDSSLEEVRTLQGTDDPSDEIPTKDAPGGAD